MHRNNSSIAMHRDRIASWHVNRDTNRIVTSLAIPTPSQGFISLFEILCSNKLGAGQNLRSRVDGFAEVDF